MWLCVCVCVQETGVYLTPESIGYRRGLRFFGAVGGFVGHSVELDVCNLVSLVVFVCRWLFSPLTQPHPMDDRYVESDSVLCP